jgi:hypothetical protein
MSEHKSWIQRNGAAAIAVLMIAGLALLMILNAN